MSYTIKNSTKIVIKSQKDFTETVLLDTTQGVTGSIVAGLPVIDVIDDSLDSFVFKINDYPTRKPFAPFDLVEFTIGNEKMQYFILTDKASTYSQARRTYTHTIACVETTKYLEKVKIFNLTLTNQLDDLYLQVEKALTNAETIYVEGGKRRSPRFTMSEELQELIQSKESRDFHFGNTDLRTVLDEMLAVHNARVVVKEVLFNEYLQAYTFELGYHKTNIAYDTTPEWTFNGNGEIIHEESENDGQDYAGQILATGYNAIPDAPLTIRDLPRSDEAQLSDMSANIFLPFPISDRGVIKCTMGAMVNYGSTTNDNDYLIKLVKVDITDRILPRDKYDLLSEKEKEHYAPYDIGSKKISLYTVYKKWTGEEVNSLSKDFKYLVSNAPPPEGYYYRDIIEGEELLTSTFEVTYYPVYDAPFSISKPSAQSNPNQLLMGIADSQTEKTLDMSLYGRKLAGLIKRTGNDTYTVDVKAKSYANLLPLLSRISLPYTGEEGYVLYKREYAVYDNFINCRYYFSQHYNAVQAAAGINREKHLFDIPLESEETPILIKKYIHISTNDIQGDGRFNYSIGKGLLDTLVGVNDYGALKYLFFRTSNYLSHNPSQSEAFPQNTEVENESDFPYKNNRTARFALQLGSYALDKTMNFIAKPLDNYSVGYSRTGYIFSIWGDGGYRTLYNRYVSKNTDFVGEVNRFALSYAYDLPGERLGSTMPIISNYANNNAMEDVATHEVNEIIVKYNKDRAQTPVFVLSLEMTVAEKDKGKVIVTPLFAKNNNLIVDGEVQRNLRLYVSREKLINEDEEYLPSNYFTSQSWKSFAVADLFSVITNGDGGGLILDTAQANALIPADFKVKSWAIVNERMRIYLAVNGGLKNIYACVSDNP